MTNQNKIATLIAFANKLVDGAVIDSQLNTIVRQLKGTPFGKSVKTCPHRAALSDAFAARGLENNTLKNAVTSAVIAVEAGVWLGFNPSRAKDRAAELAANADNETKSKKGSRASKSDSQKLAQACANWLNNPHRLDVLAGGKFSADDKQKITAAFREYSETFK
jgi:hypothetical protein